MIANLKPYPETRDSGIQWLGEVPEHWEVRQLGRFGAFSKGSGGTKEDEVAEGVSCVRYGNLYTQHRFFIEKTKACVSIDRSANYTPIQYGDVLFAGSGETIEEIGKSAVNLLFGPACCGGDVIIFRPSGAIDAKFLGLATDCSQAAYQKSCMGRGITVMHIYGDELKYLSIAIPPLPEQAAIADFLDRETAKIDALVEKKERLIELLQEKRTALITHAVTKGLDPDVPMKDSGIEWLGQIPAHWKSPRAQDCADLKVGYAFSSDSFLHGESDVGVKLLRGDNVTTGALRWGERTRRWSEVTPGISHLLLQENDVVIGMDGSKVGRNYALVKSEDLPLLLVQRVARLRPKQRIMPQYLFFSIANPRFHMHVDLEKSDPAIPHVSGWAIAHYPVLLPPLEEQEAIVEHIERETTKIDALIAKVGEAIKRLKEYRTALISAAVTGKIDVRECIPDAKS